MIDLVCDGPITVAGNLVEYELRLLEIVANCGPCMYSWTIFLWRSISMLNIIITISHRIASLACNLELSFRPISSVKFVRKTYSMPVPWFWIFGIHVMGPLVTSLLRTRRSILL